MNECIRAEISFAVRGRSRKRFDCHFWGAAGRCYVKTKVTEWGQDFAPSLYMVAFC